MTTRLAATLLRLAGDDGNDVTGVSHRDLAEMVGGLRETVTPVLNDLRAGGLIELHRMHIRILDSKALQHLTEA